MKVRIARVALALMVMWAVGIVVPDTRAPFAPAAAEAGKKKGNKRARRLALKQVKRADAPQEGPGAAAQRVGRGG